MATTEEARTRTPAPRRARRQWSIRLHRWTGFALMAWFVFEAVTGSYLTISDDLDRWTSPGRYEHAAGDVGPKAAALAATTKVEGSVAETVIFPAEEHGVYDVIVKDEDGDRSEVFVNPGNGHVNEVSDPDGGFDVLVLELHADFNLVTIFGVPTRTIMGWLGIGWVVNLLLGFWVMRRRRRALRPSWAFRSGRRPRAFHLAVHNWTGLVILAPLGVAVLTGVAFEFPAQSESVINALLPGSTHDETKTATPFSMPTADGRRISLDDVADSVRNAKLGTVQSISVPLGNPAGVYNVAVDAGGYSPRTGGGRTITVYADQYSGQVLSVSDPVARTTATQVSSDWVAGLHFGTFGSWFSKVLWVLIGVGTVALGVTALGMRKGRFPWQKQRRAAGAVRRGGPDSVQPELSGEADEPALVGAPELDERNDV